jgi:hypothetical protein
MVSELTGKWVRELQDLRHRIEPLKMMQIDFQVVLSRYETCHFSSPVE